MYICQITPTYNAGYVTIFVLISNSAVAADFEMDEPMVTKITGSGGALAFNLRPLRLSGTD